MPFCKDGQGFCMSKGAYLEQTIDSRDQEESLSSCSCGCSVGVRTWTIKLNIPCA